MRKLKLDVENVRVESFEVLPAAARTRGTIAARALEDEGDTAGSGSAAGLGALASQGCPPPCTLATWCRTCVPYCLSFVTCTLCPDSADAG